MAPLIYKGGEFKVLPWRVNIIFIGWSLSWPGHLMISYYKLIWAENGAYIANITYSISKCSWTFFIHFWFSLLKIVSKMMIINLKARVYQIIFSSVSICNTFVVQNIADRAPNFKMAGFGKTRTSSKVQYRLFLGIIGDFDDVSVVLWFKRYSFSSKLRSFLWYLSCIVMSTARTVSSTDSLSCWNVYIRRGRGLNQCEHMS